MSPPFNLNLQNCHDIYFPFHPTSSIRSWYLRSSRHSSIIHQLRSSATSIAHVILPSSVRHLICPFAYLFLLHSYKLHNSKYILAVTLSVGHIYTKLILTHSYSLSILRQMFYGQKLFNTPNSYFFFLIIYILILFSPCSLKVFFLVFIVCILIFF